MEPEGEVVEPRRNGEGHFLPVLRGQGDLPVPFCKVYRKQASPTRSNSMSMWGIGYASNRQCMRLSDSMQNLKDTLSLGTNMEGLLQGLTSQGSCSLPALTSSGRTEEQGGWEFAPPPPVGVGILCLLPVLGKSCRTHCT